MALADALANVEPEANLGGDQGVQPGFLHGQVLPGSGAGSRDDAGDSVADGRDVCGGGWRQFNLGVLHENVELGPSVGQQRWKWNLFRIVNYVTQVHQRGAAIENR